MCCLTMSGIPPDFQSKIRKLDSFPLKVEMAIADNDLIPGITNGSLENAIRAWATSDPKVAELISNVDRQRLNYTKALFLEIGFSEAEAQVRARLAYYSLVGELTIGVPTNQANRLAEIRMQHAILTSSING